MVFFIFIKIRKDIGKEVLHLFSELNYEMKENKSDMD